MCPERFSVADVDGVFCIKYTTTDYSNPSIITHYWPTRLFTRDVLSFFFDDANNASNLTKLHVSKALPGEYFIGTKGNHFGAPWKQGQHVRLIDGGATQPIQTDVKDAPTPKLRKGTDCYWSGGRWVKRTKTGKPENIDPLTV